MGSRTATLQPFRNTMLQAVLFDVDGTLGDTLPLCVEAYRAATEEITGRRPSAEEVVSHFGLSDRGVLAALLGMQPDDPTLPIECFVRAYERLMPQYATAPFPGARELLEALRAAGLRLGLVTGKEACTGEPTLDAFGLNDGIFEWKGYGSPYRNVKDVRLREAMEHWGLGPQQLLYVGDAPSDITLARAAGVRILNAAWAPGAEADRAACEAEHPDFRLTDIQEALPLILSLT